MGCLNVRYFIGIVFLYSSLLPGQEVRVLNEANVTPTQSVGVHRWYDVESDPDNTNNLIICGARWDAQDNANYGFVYASQDGGSSWHIALEDKSSKWVTEESCAFGVHGIAYFIADASKIDNAGMLHHEHGVTRIWASRDAGRTWTLGTTTGWTDFSSSTVDRTPGPNQNRLYSFFNNIWTYYTSINDTESLRHIPKWSVDKNGQESSGNTIGLVSYKVDDAGANGPVFNPDMYKQLYHGSYPAQNLLLKDGSLVTLFWSKKRTFGIDKKQTGREFILAAQHSDPQRKSLSEPAVLQHWFDGPGQPEMKCNAYLSAPAAYDSNTNTIYATYLDGSADKCTLILAESTDDGQTWKARPWIEATEGTAFVPHGYESLTMARRGDGTFALLWHDDVQKDCWLFATSSDNGKTYTHPQRLSSCGKDGGAYHVTSNTLDFYMGQADENNASDDAGLRIETYSGDVTVHANGIAVDRDGIFHPVWVDYEGELHTASVAVINERARSKASSSGSDGWRYQTNKVKFIYGGTQQYDSKTHTLTESVVVVNSGTELLKGELRLEIAPSSQSGVIYPLDTSNAGSGDSIVQYLDAGQYVHGDGLAPGASSTPIPLRFHYEPYGDAKQSGSVAYVSLRLLVKGQEK